MSSSNPTVIVTIRGSVTPCVVLPRGETRTVALTSRIQRLIDKGFVDVIDRQEINPAKKSSAPRRTATKKSSDV